MVLHKHCAQFRHMKFLITTKFIYLFYFFNFFLHFFFFGMLKTYQEFVATVIQEKRKAIIQRLLQQSLRHVIAERKTRKSRRTETHHYFVCKGFGGKAGDFGAKCETPGFLLLQPSSLFILLKSHSIYDHMLLAKREKVFVLFAFFLVETFFFSFLSFAFFSCVR